MEFGPMGPIGEGGSLLLRVNRNCPWNGCLFCPVYKGHRFSPRSSEEIKTDIDCAHRVWDILDKSSWAMGLGGRISDAVLKEVVKDRPEIFGTDDHAYTSDHAAAFHTLRNVALWVHSGASRVFLQDADALAMKPGELAGILEHLKQRFPTIDTVSTYARSKTCARRSVKELSALKECGLGECLVGMESGSDAVLSFMHKGVSASETVEALIKLGEAGIKAAAFVMPGLGGRNRELADHMDQTLKVLNAGKPSEVRVRSLAVIEGTPLSNLMQAGAFIHPLEEQMIEEIGRLIEGLSLECEFETLQMTNTLFTYKGSLPRDRQALLKAILDFQALPGHEKAAILLDRCVTGGYLDFIRSWGLYDDMIEQAIEAADGSIRTGDPDALDKTNEALRLIKSKGIP